MPLSANWGRAPAHLARGQDRLVYVVDRELESARQSDDLFGHSSELQVSIVQWVERAREHAPRRWRLVDPAAVSKQGDTSELTGDELYDRVA